MIPAGIPAPDFSLPDTTGRQVELRQSGVPVLVVFLPAAFTPVCSGELHALDRVREAVPEGARVVAVACDSMFALRTWRDQERVGVELLSDFWPHGRVSRAFGAFDAGSGLSTRASFAIDTTGVVRWSTQSPAGIARDMDEHATKVRELREYGDCG
ncbi:MAG: redoxin domain-containing protein [Beutenbergiaceae bacterium]